MTRLTRLLLVLLISFCSLTHAHDFDAALSLSDYNGVYEGVIQTNRGGGIYGLGGKKSLVRLHVFVYNYPNTKYRDMYDRVAKKTVRPRTVLGIVEVYNNKKGKGIPIRNYFTARS